jgi:hypothetical protein
MAVMCAALVPLVAGEAAAQESARTIGQYDKEAGVQYVAAWENGDRWGNGVLLQGGYKVGACGFMGWQCQGIAELSVMNFDYFDASFKQFSLGVRLGRMMWPRIRTYGQFQVGVQNDGFENSSNGVVYSPGLGLNYAVTRRFDAQVLFDFPIAKFDKGTYNQARLGIGVGLPLGRR